MATVATMQSSLGKRLGDADGDGSHTQVDMEPSPKRLRMQSDFAGAAPEHGDEDDMFETWDSPSSSAPSVSQSSVAGSSATSMSKSRRPKKYACDYPECDKIFDRPIRLQMHVRSHTNDRPFVCQEEGCGKSFLRNEHLTRHMKDKHSEEKDFVCSYILQSETGEDMVCDKSFTTATRLRRHVAAHESKEETTCQEPGCGKLFRKQETLQRHIRIDHLGEAYICDHIHDEGNGSMSRCDKSFSKPDQLKKHQAREHSGVRYFCEQCPPPPELPIPSHFDDDAMSTTTDSPHRPGFSTYTDLQTHLKLAHPPICPECQQICPTNRALKAHIDIEHTSLASRQKFPCPEPGCDRSFTKAGNRQVHVQNVHAKNRPFVCGSHDLSRSKKVIGWNGRGCENAFGTKANLEEHVRTQHLGLPSKLQAKNLAKKGIKVEQHQDMQQQDASRAQHTDEIAMLTGFGYDTHRQLSCLVAPACAYRFSREYDLAQHLELAHGWNVDDINDRLAVVRNDGQSEEVDDDRFWIGGVDAGREGEEEFLRGQLMNFNLEAGASGAGGEGAVDPALL